VNFVKSGIDIVFCPFCTGGYLCHKRVEVFERSCEDSSFGITMTLNEGNVTVGTDAETGNPSSRRSGIRIRFWCEECHSSPALVLYQQKGNTITEWET
jgi:hypothetical protein